MGKHRNCRDREPITAVVDILPSPFGWIGLAVSERGVFRVTVGHASRESALRACRSVVVWQRQVPARVAALAERLRRALEAYVCGEMVGFDDIPLDWSPVTPFQQRVYLHCRRVRYGATSTYGEVAVALGKKGAARAVGQALSRNPYALVVPCHRILGSNGDLTGFTAPGGLRLKERLLAFEREVAARNPYRDAH